MCSLVSWQDHGEIDDNNDIGYKSHDLKFIAATSLSRSESADRKEKLQKGVKCK